MSKLKMWQQHPSWEQAEKAWDEGAKEAALTQPIKGLTCLPSMPGITSEAAKHLKWKSLKWIIDHDKDKKIRKSFLKHPVRYGWAFLKSILRQKPYLREGDFFLYGINQLTAFYALLKTSQTLFVIGFSYCHKPFECPSGRFTDQCIHDVSNPVCRQCFIGKCVNALPEKDAVPLFIPTIHYVGGKILDLIEEHPDKQIIFLITACEMTLEMFGNLGNMAAIRGVGVRLDGRICNTMKAFELSENGIKPGLTVVLDDTQKQMLKFIKYRRENYV